MSRMLRMSEDDYANRQARHTAGMKQGKMPLNPREADTMTQGELAAMQLEKNIVKSCMDYLGHDRRVKLRYESTFVGHGIFTPRGGGRSRPISAGYPGQPDISGMLEDGRLLAPEVKRPGQKLKPHQEVVRDIIIGYYGVAGRVDGPDSLRAMIDEAVSESRVVPWLRHLAALYPVAFDRVVLERMRGAT